MASGEGVKASMVFGGLVVIHPVEDEVIRLLAVSIDERPATACRVVAIVEL